MKKHLQYQLPADIAFHPEAFRNFVLKKEHLSTGDTADIRLLKRSVDARGKKVKVLVQAEIAVGEPLGEPITYCKDYPNVSKKEPIVIVGAGPAGMFAALRLIELGIKPIILERGKEVRARRRDIAAINKQHVVGPDSNYCFGEGGAGTYSDGKLYTRSKKRGDFRRILEIFVAHGATEEILADAHPHIGTNKLPKIVEAMRESILAAGGEIRFGTRVTDLMLSNGEIQGVIDQHGEQITGNAVILATGHSARDIFYLLNEKKVEITAKPFALGVRVEHPQGLIDSIQYNLPERGDYLPAAAYSLVSQIKYKGQEKGVFSFCMCPGGFIVPAATTEGEVVVNGMSPSRRNSKFANSGIVVPIGPEDIKPYAQHGALAGLAFQQAVEQQACAVGGGTQAAPAQRLVDFVSGKVSGSLVDTSYQPGLVSADLRQVLPKAIAHRLKFGFLAFGKKMRGYLTNDAQIIGVESRTSSPVSIPRDRERLEHVQIRRLYPCGEGAGYAGGIASAAMDGERCAEEAAKRYGKIA